MLIDDIHITIKAGDGGDGMVHLYHDAHRPKGGPDGGKGGDGGSVYFQAVSDISRLNQYRHNKVYLAQAGEKGGTNNKSGKNGKDLILQVPVGTVVSYDNGTSIEFVKPDEMKLVAKGGKGGWGNWYFRSATNQTPEEFQPGQKTLEKNLHLQLKLIAQVGLIGLPNTGKTSLLNELTSAAAKVANYSFTTLEPNLGVTKGGFIIADIPGLIEGAALGKGLGFKFLKHIERTNVILHCLSAESQDPIKDYQIVRKELENYSSKLATKDEIIIITKSDLITPNQLKKIKKNTKAVLAVSVIDDSSLKNLNDFISLKLS